MFDLQLFRAAQRDFQSVGQIVGHVIAAHRQHPGVLDDAVRVDRVIRRAAADVHHQRAHFLLFIGQQRQRRRQPVEHDCLDFQLQALDDANRVLQPVEIAVDHMHVHLQPRAEHAHGIDDPVLVVHLEMLPHGVQYVVLRGQIDRLGVLDDVLDVLLGDVPVGRHHRMGAAIVEAADVAAGHTEINAANFHVRHLLGLDNGVAHVLLGGGRVGDLALAHAARAGLAQPNDVRARRRR